MLSELIYVRTNENGSSRLASWRSARAVHQLIKDLANEYTFSEEYCERM